MSKNNLLHKKQGIHLSKNKYPKNTMAKKIHFSILSHGKGIQKENGQQKMSVKKHFKLQKKPPTKQNKPKIIQRKKLPHTTSNDIHL